MRSEKEIAKVIGQLSYSIEQLKAQQSAVAVLEETLKVQRTKSGGMPEPSKLSNLISEIAVEALQQQLSILNWVLCKPGKKKYPDFHKGGHVGEGGKVINLHQYKKDIK